MRKQKNQEKTNIEKGRMYGDIFIPLKLENIILRHILINSIKPQGFNPNPILVLQGKKGEGKSFMTETILKGNNIYYKMISSSKLAGRKEGEAVDNLMLYYNKCEMNPENGKYSALVIDDFHLSIAITKDEAGHTTNADNLLEALMNIADHKKELKVPIILIGNNFEKAYPPLMRSGRATICTWEPTLEDKKIIVDNLIKQRNSKKNISYDSVSKFVEKYQEQYIGFFDKVIENVCFDSLEDMTSYFADNKGVVPLQELYKIINNNIHSNDITIKKLEEKAEALIKNNLKKLDE